MLYLIEEVELSGDYKPNGSREHTVLYLQRKPGRTNRGQKEVFKGWLGTTNGVYVYAHGEFEDKETAEAYIEAEFPHHRLSDAQADLDRLAEEGTYVYRGAPCYDAFDWFQYVGASDLGVRPDSTDTELKALAKELEKEALDEGCIVFGVLDYLRESQQRLRDSNA